MRRPQLESKFLKHKTPESRQIYTKQRNYCSRLYKKERKKYYNNLNINKITDNKQFWETVKPFYLKKELGLHTLILLITRKLYLKTGMLHRP